MPLQQGKSKKVFNENVDELLSAWRRTKRVGNSTPKNVADARKQALAIAFNQRKK